MELTKPLAARPCAALLEEYAAHPRPLAAEKLRFAGVGERDVYNITRPFLDEGELVIAGRVEDRRSERSTTMFFVERDGSWVPREQTFTLELQDPFFTQIGGMLVFGGVEVLFDEHGERVVSWQTAFYRGACIRHLKRFATGPLQMKDIRLVELPNGTIGVLTRPLGLADARALIGYTSIETLDDLTPQVIESATLFRDQFLPVEWGGANEAHVLANGLVGVLGHIASMEAGNIRHYHAMTFALNPTTGARSPLKIIATRAEFPDGPAKRPDLHDVIFSGGIERQPDGTAWLYAGVSDAEAHRILIADPFLEYERV